MRRSALRTQFGPVAETKCVEHRGAECLLGARQRARLHPAPVLVAAVIGHDPFAGYGPPDGCRHRRRRAGPRPDDTAAELLDGLGEGRASGQLDPKSFSKSFGRRREERARLLLPAAVAGRVWLASMASAGEARTRRSTGRSGRRGRSARRLTRRRRSHRCSPSARPRSSITPGRRRRPRAGSRAPGDAHGLRGRWRDGRGHADAVRCRHVTTGRLADVMAEGGAAGPVVVVVDDEARLAGAPPPVPPPWMTGSRWRR